MRIVTFGEVMLRLAPEGFLRLRQVIPGRLEATFGGGELNVAVSIAFQGGRSAYMTATPDNPVSDALVQEMRKLGVETDLIHRVHEGRFGVYFVETGANQRGGTVTYDRNDSSIAVTSPGVYDWDAAFTDANWLHVTGITPAVSENAAAAALEGVQRAKDRGLTVSCDLNFRKKLWRWSPDEEPVALARRTMRELAPHFDVVIANEEDADLALGISAPETNVEAGELNVAGYEHVAREIVSQFSNVRAVVITLRESVSASHNNWGAMIYDADSDVATFAPLDENGDYRPYEIRDIVDRVGAGDSFAGALIFALNTPELQAPDTALRYAVAASCLKHSIRGDFNYATREEIEALMHGAAAGRVSR